MTPDRRSTARFEEMRATMRRLGDGPAPTDGQRRALRAGRLRGVF